MAFLVSSPSHQVKLINNLLSHLYKSIGLWFHLFVKFMPDGKFFDSDTFSISKLRHNLRSKAVLCPGLKITFHNEIDETKDQWTYKDGLKDYLSLLRRLLIQSVIH
jgi:DNA gyrase/topoisomerase IV subunit B